MPVRFVVTQYVEGLVDVVRNPIHATAVGLLLYGKEAVEAQVDASASQVGVSGAFGRMNAWFQGNF